jgi:hypothetical protein
LASSAGRLPNPEAKDFFERVKDMNTVVLLLLTTCAPADPALGPQVHSTPSAANCGCSTQAHEGRPGFFARVRGIFHRKSQGNEYTTSTVAPITQEVVAPQHMGSVKQPRLAPVVSAEPPLDLTVAPTVDTQAAQKMPGGPSLK